MNYLTEDRIKDIHIAHDCGGSIRFISRKLGIAKETVRRYVRLYRDNIEYIEKRKIFPNKHYYTKEEDLYLLNNMNGNGVTVKEQAMHLKLSYYSVYEHIQCLKGKYHRHIIPVTARQHKFIKKIANNVLGAVEELPVLNLCKQNIEDCSKCIFNTYCNKNYRVISSGSVIARRNNGAEKLITVNI